ncbi:ABC transporter permease [Dactylosporangium sp. NBC_01737]|uniref:ABC transporter permease n=1 Tax=Dactylosporangium sp. NBC_01737 TaxID=2975959 RepID=UPI002E0D70EA|nr:ABC transporter permease [Dactylosporangium sp. NBC_01737]
MMLKLTLRSLAAHRLRLMFTAVAVLLGVSFVAGTMIFRDTASRSFDSTFSGLDSAREVFVYPKQTFTGEGTPQVYIPESLGQTVQQVPGAQAWLGATEGYAAILTADGTIVGGDNAAHLGREYVERPGSKSTVKLIAGRKPVGDTELVVETHTATEGRIAVGDELTVVTERAEKSMRVVGIYDLGEDQLGDAVTFVGFAPDVAQQMLTSPGHYSAIWVRPRDGVTPRQLADQLTAALPAQYEVKTAQEQAQDTKKEIQGIFDVLGRFLLAFAGISVLVGSFIIFNTFTMLVAQRTREMALLRAVGASRAQVTRAVLGEAIGIGLVGSTLGLAAGVGVSLVLRLLFERFGTTLPDRAPVIEPGTVLWSYVVGLLVTVLAAYLPARRAAKIPPVAALRDGGTPAPRGMRRRTVLGLIPAVIGGLALAGGLSSGGEDGSGLVVIGGVLLFLAAVVLSPVLSRPVTRLLGWPIGLVAGAIGRLGVENARRDPRRTAATASALMVGLALVSLATVVAGSMSASVDKRLDAQFGADFSMDPRGLTGFSADAVDRVAAVPGVRGVVPVRSGTVRLGDEEASVTVADPAALTVPVRLKVTDGATTLGADQLLVQKTVADQRGWKVGSTIPGRYPDGTAVTFTVAGLFADNQVLNRPYLIAPAGYGAHTTATLIQRAFVDIDDARLAAAGDGVRQVLKAYPNIQLKDRQDAKDDARADIDQALNVIMVLLLLSIAIAAVGIVNTLGLAVVERTREIGLLRAVGMKRRQVRAMIRYESVVIAVFGAALGLLLGVGLGVATQRVLAGEGIEVLDIDAVRLALYLLSAIVIGVVAAIWPAWRAARMDVLKAIHHE